MKIKYRIIGIIALVVIFILNVKVGCPSDFNDLLRYMFHEDFPKEYEVVKKSETTLFQYLFGKRECSYEIEISRPDNNELGSKLKGTNFWRNSHAKWKSDPCLTSPEKYCDENELEQARKLKGTKLICYAHYKPSSLILSLNCYDY
jgi:hypothetical protein